MSNVRKQMNKLFKFPLRAIYYLFYDNKEKALGVSVSEFENTEIDLKDIKHWDLQILPLENESYRIPLEVKDVNTNDEMLDDMRRLTAKYVSVLKDYTNLR